MPTGEARALTAEVEVKPAEAEKSLRILLRSSQLRKRNK